MSHSKSLEMPPQHPTEPYDRSSLIPNFTKISVVISADQERIASPSPRTPLRNDADISPCCSTMRKSKHGLTSPMSNAHDEQQKQPQYTNNNASNSGDSIRFSSSDEDLIYTVETRFQPGNDVQMSQLYHGHPNTLADFSSMHYRLYK